MKLIEEAAIMADFIFDKNTQPIAEIIALMRSWKDKHEPTFDDKRGSGQAICLYAGHILSIGLTMLPVEEREDACAFISARTMKTARKAGGIIGLDIYAAAHEEMKNVGQKS